VLTYLAVSFVYKERFHTLEICILQLYWQRMESSHSCHRSFLHMQLLLAHQRKCVRTLCTLNRGLTYGPLEHKSSIELSCMFIACDDTEIKEVKASDA
jgi:hypothetical protein